MKVINVKSLDVTLYEDHGVIEATGEDITPEVILPRYDVVDYQVIKKGEDHFVVRTTIRQAAPLAYVDNVPGRVTYGSLDRFIRSTVEKPFGYYYKQPVDYIADEAMRQRYHQHHRDRNNAAMQLYRDAQLYKIPEMPGIRELYESGNEHYILEIIDLVVDGSIPIDSTEFIGKDLIDEVVEAVKTLLIKDRVATCVVRGARYTKNRIFGGSWTA